jgi:hypothetical protein
MRVHYYFRALFLLLAASVLLTEQQYGFGQIVFIYGIYVLSYFFNKLMFRPDLMSALHRQLKATKSFFFRGDHYETMDEVTLEKTFLATTGASSRVQVRRWATRGLFGVFVFSFYSLHKSGKVVTTAVGLFHLLIASTFLPMESLSHTLLPLGLNVTLITFYLAYNKTASPVMIALYFTALFLALGLFGYSFVAKKFSTRANLNLRVRSSLRLLGMWALMAAILYTVLPGESIKELIREPVEKLEKVVEQKIDEHLMPALQKAADSQLPNFEEVNRQTENNPAQQTKMPMPKREEIKALQEEIRRAQARGGFEKLKFPKAGDVKGGPTGEVPDPTSGGSGYTEIRQANAQGEYEKIKKQLEEFGKLPLQQQEAKKEDLEKMDEALAQLEKVVDQAGNPETPQQPEASLPMPSNEELKAVQEKLLEEMNRNGVSPPQNSQTDSAPPNLNPADVDKEFKDIKEQVDNFNKLPPKQQQAQAGKLKDISQQLSQVEKAVEKKAVQKQSEQLKAAQKLEPPLPRFELPNLDRWWPFLKLLGFLFIAYIIFSLVSPFLQKNDERKAQEKKLSKKDKAKLRAFLKNTQEIKYKDERDEVIRKYHAFLEVMEFIHRPRHESLPPEDFGEFLKQDLRRNLQELDSLTWGFSDVLYGEKSLEPDRMNNFRKSFNEMARSFLNIS